MSRREFCAGAVSAAALMLAGCAASNSQAGVTAPSSTTAGTPPDTVPDAPAPAPPPPPGPEAYAGQVPTSFGTALPGITETVPTAPGTRTIALTFDGCGGPDGSGIDQLLIDTLREFRVPATLFLAEPWIKANPEATRNLVADPLFRLENHGTVHRPLSVSGAAAYGIAGTDSPAAAIEEIEGNRAALAGLGVESTWFRSGTAHYDDVAVRIAADRGIQIAGFSLNGDDGATATAQMVASRILAAPDGSIVLAHMNHPGSGTAPGVRGALEALRVQQTPVRFVFVDGSTP